METSTALLEIAKALSKMQGEMKSVPKDSTNPFFKMRYASLDAIWDTIRKPLADNGLSVIQTTYEQATKIYMETTLLHVSGEWVRTYLPINAVKQDPQSIGSAMTYTRRYSLSAILGISADEDEDGNLATGKAEVAKVEKTKQAPAEHYCPVHKTTFFKTPKMRSFAHPIGDTGEWCYEPAEKPATVKPPPAPTPTESHKDGTEVVAGQDAPKYKTDPSTLKSYQDLCNACFADFKVDDGKGRMSPMQPADIVKELGLKSKSEIADIPDAYRKIARVRK